MYKVLFILLLILFNSASAEPFPALKTNESFLRNIVHTLSVSIGPRNLEHYQSLQRASQFIQQEFVKLGYEVKLQKFSVFEKEVENIIVNIGPQNAERIIIGAHYDTFGKQPGADDNASAIAGLIGLAKLLKEQDVELKKRIELVAFTLEEPPFFRSEAMGSYVHAKSLHDQKIKVRGMICLEMIGYFTNENKSQDYPLGLLKLFYPDQGNFIGVVSNFSSSGLKAAFRDSMKKADIPVESLSAPAALVGVDFSDHSNYWKFGHDAIMITDTAFYRNPHYHQMTDTIDTLNFKKMANVVDGVYYGVIDLAY